MGEQVVSVERMYLAMMLCMRVAEVRIMSGVEVEVGGARNCATSVGRLP